MHRVSLLRFTSVRLALIYLLLFLVSFFAANFVAYSFVETYLHERLDANVKERFSEIVRAYDREGIAGATAMIASHGPEVRNGETLYSLYDPGGHLLAGNTDLNYVGPGLSTTIPTSHDFAPRNYRFFSDALDGHRLVVGISYDDTNTLRNIAIGSFSIATAIALATGLSSAAFLAIRTRRRILAVTEAMEAVASGEFHTRLPVSGNLDEIDALGSSINVTLGRLEESVATIKRVTTDIAHDLKTPIGRLMLLLDDALSAKSLQSSNEMIHAAIDEARQITLTFEALLRISQIEARARRSNVRLVNLRELVQDVFATYSPVFEDSGRIILLEDLIVGSAPVAGDSDLLRQMIVNVFNNNIRHTPVGSICVVRIERQPLQIVLTVADNGPGIPAEERDRVFRRFYRIDNNRSGEGTGLGLSLVEAVVNFHDGTVELADNAPGLKVVVTLPAMAVGALDSQKKISARGGQSHGRITSTASQRDSSA